ncbi:hypothetical protein A7K93_05050 [Candidatus Methylacidiphilum fumarolicum]|uniref:Uncharacterized protein n=2 Tax=Candidatus Methylacidiphilum fumarolicum TaxID=591154 RepID=I0JZL3_METFB|nr:hypothetical protein A7K93_05050 [Candidatus Methylacidiphilum fumarolicum]TFE74167.1 hypothetical protein A7D33_02195 [Candidatus Methylacidiphilum fumarolicum]TFE74918.1 hypothetical protein A7K72_02745 [Candidatus Methylacidiphilum fumarolicum]CAI9085234.1 conserved protein of unknown function [Candidatus Methylacidiphilum fumarolicum]CCG92682.1 hypothetical protein MFUM_720049 [Methylacidiphilum fumariolicum SolV]
MPVLWACKLYEQGWRIQPQGKDRRSGDMSVDTARMAACDPFGEVLPQYRETIRLESRCGALSLGG